MAYAGAKRNNFMGGEAQPYFPPPNGMKPKGLPMPGRGKS